MDRQYINRYVYYPRMLRLLRQRETTGASPPRLEREAMILYMRRHLDVFARHREAYAQSLGHGFRSIEYRMYHSQLYEAEYLLNMIIRMFFTFSVSDQDFLARSIKPLMNISAIKAYHQLMVNLITLKCFGSRRIVSMDILRFSRRVIRERAERSLYDEICSFLGAWIEEMRHPSHYEGSHVAWACADMYRVWSRYARLPPKLDYRRLSYLLY